MTLEAGLIRFIGGTNIFGNRVFPMIVPQEMDLPACAVQRFSGPRDHTHSGPSGLVNARVQVSVVGQTYQEAKESGEMLRSALDGYVGTMGEMSVGLCFLVNEMDGASDLGERQVVRYIYMIGYREGV